MLRSMLQDGQASAPRPISSKEYLLQGSVQQVGSVPRTGSVGSLNEDEMFENFHGLETEVESPDAVSDDQPGSPVDSLQEVDNDEVPAYGRAQRWPTSGQAQWNYQPVDLSTHSLSTSWASSDRSNALLTVADPLDIQRNSALRQRQLGQLSTNGVGMPAAPVWSSQSLGMPVPIRSTRSMSRLGSHQESPPFIPPHQLVSSQDPISSSNVSSLKGYQAVRMRERILSRNGYRDGKTEHIHIGGYPQTYS